MVLYARDAPSRWSLPAEPQRGRARALLVGLVVLSFALVTLDLGRGASGPLAPVHRTGATVLGALERGAAAVPRPAQRLVRALGSGSDDQAELERLRADNARLTEQLQTTRTSAAGPAAGLVAAPGYAVLAARVLAVSTARTASAQPSWTATLDAGTSAGVQGGMTVVDTGGLVGRVTATGTDTATVLLTVDPGSSVGVRVASSGQIGVLTGDGSGPLQLELLDPQAGVRVGDRLSTVGSQGGSTYAPGVLVATVTRIDPAGGGLTRTARASAVITPTALGTVGVLVPAAGAGSR